MLHGLHWKCTSLHSAMSVLLSADGLLADARGQAFRHLCAALGHDFEGLATAARRARKQGVIDARWCKRLVRLDEAFSLVRHLSAQRVTAFVSDLEAALVKNKDLPIGDTKSAGDIDMVPSSAPATSQGAPTSAPPSSAAATSPGAPTSPPPSSAAATSTSAPLFAPPSASFSSWLAQARAVKAPSVLVPTAPSMSATACSAPASSVNVDYWRRIEAIFRDKDPDMLKCMPKLIRNCESKGAAPADLHRTICEKYDVDPNLAQATSASGPSALASGPSSTSPPSSAIAPAIGDSIEELEAAFARDTAPILTRLDLRYDASEGDRKRQF